MKILIALIILSTESHKLNICKKLKLTSRKKKAAIILGLSFSLIGIAFYIKNQFERKKLKNATDIISTDITVLKTHPYMKYHLTHKQNANKPKLIIYCNNNDLIPILENLKLNKFSQNIYDNKYTIEDSTTFTEKFFYILNIDEVQLKNMGKITLAKFQLNHFISYLGKLPRILKCTQKYFDEIKIKYKSHNFLHFFKLSQNNGYLFHAVYLNESELNESQLKDKFTYMIKHRESSSEPELNENQSILDLIIANDNKYMYLEK